MANPLVRALGLREIEQRDRQEPPKTIDIATMMTEPALAGHVRAAWGLSLIHI